MVKTMVLSPVPVELLIHQIRYQFSSNYPLILFNFSSGGVHKYTTVFSHQFSNWASKTPGTYGSYYRLFPHRIIKKRAPKNNTESKTIMPYLALFFWGAGFWFGVIYLGRGVQRGGFESCDMYIYIYINLN